MKNPIIKTNPASRLSLTFAASLALLSINVTAQERNEREAELSRTMSTLRYYTDRGTTEEPRLEEGEVPRLNLDADGVLKHLGASPGHAFEPLRKVEGQPVETARHFIEDNRLLLGLTSPNASMIPLRTRQSSDRTYVRLQQTYAELPVFAGQMSVQLNDALGVEFLSSDISLQVNSIESDPDWATPEISEEEAAVVVSQQVKESSGAEFTVGVQQLMVFDPAVLGETGSVQLVWEVIVDSVEDPNLNYQWLVNAKSGGIAQRYPLTHSALNRTVRDSNDTTAWPGTVVRQEGDPASGIMDADNAYTFSGDTYNFFNNNHGLDSYNGSGAVLNLTVRYCASVTNCPWGNAQWTGTVMRFGNGFATDDVVAHEFTHAVTETTSQLVYANASGAINESLSDIWGEFVDLTNSSGDDSAGVRWDMGEDLPGGRLRSMSDPPARNDPDRLGSSLYIPATNNPNGGNDFGGVHTNSGVNNKLCFLLVDGDTFNGWTINGMGINPVADLYYEANANLLTSGSNWNDLYEALRQAAVNLGWNADDRNNLYRACRAVEIASSDDIYIDWASGCFLKNGFPMCLIVMGPYQTVNQGVSGAFPGDRLFIRGGSYNESVTFQEIATVRSYDGTAVIGD